MSVKLNHIAMCDFMVEIRKHLKKYVVCSNYWIDKTDFTKYEGNLDNDLGVELNAIDCKMDTLASGFASRIRADVDPSELYPSLRYPKDNSKKLLKSYYKS